MGPSPLQTRVAGMADKMEELRRAQSSLWRGVERVLPTFLKTLSAPDNLVPLTLNLICVLPVCTLTNHPQKLILGLELS